MVGSAGTSHLATRPKSRWIRYALLALLLEKGVQHVAVTLALTFNWMDIASTVAVDPTTLAVLGSVVAVLFWISLWGMIVGRRWASALVVGLALFDFIGEFVAQGTLAITITVSFLVATMIVILAILYRRGERNLNTA